MEFTVLLVGAKTLSQLVNDFKSKMCSEEQKSTGIILTSEKSDRSGATSILAFNFGKPLGVGGRIRQLLPTELVAQSHNPSDWREPFSTWSPASGFYSATVTFERRANNMFRVIISVDGGENMYPSTDSELQVIDRFKYPLKAIANSSDVIYRSDWLYDEDERVREEAIAGLEKVDARTAVEQLTEFFKHDTSDAVREKAAQALGRIGSEEAAKQMHKAVSNYLDGDRSKPGLIATCAEALGSMRSREALDSLNQLLGLFEKKQLTTQAHTVKQAIYRIQYGRRLQETICIVCNQPIDEESELLQCPACKGVAHRDQLLEWLHVKDYCPKCHRHIDVSDVKGVSLSDLPSKTQARSHGRKR